MHRKRGARAVVRMGVGFAALLALTASAATGPGDEPAARLRSSDKWIRKSAVEALVKLGDDKALLLVVESLADPAGEVADTAEWRLGELASDVVVRALLGSDGVRARDAWVRRRAWGILGRLPAEQLRAAFGSVAWRRGLGDDDVAVRVAALRAAERAIADATDVGLRRGIAAALRSKEPEVVAAALLAASRSAWPDRAAWLRGYVDDRRALVRGAVAACAPDVFDSAAAADVLSRLVDDPDPLVRAVVVEATARVDLEAAAPLLVACLAREGPLALRQRAWRALRRRSGWRHGIESPAWEAWAAAPTVRDLATDEPVEVSTSLAAYVPPSDRVVLLLDLSGSVWRERDDGTCPRDDLVAALARIVERFDADTLFDVGTFTDQVEFAEGGLRAASRARVKSAGRFLDDAKRVGPGNLWSALEAALGDPRVDTVVLLTDGVPTGGRRHRLELLALEWGAWTRARPIALEVLLVDAPPRVHRAWQAIVAGGGGRVLDARLGGL